MLRVTRLTDYGVLLMSHMAASEKELFSAVELADATRIPAPTVSKILQSLLRDGLLESIRGPKGGYRLARPAEKISMRDIIAVFEGAIALTECNLENTQCDQAQSCTTSDSWRRINLAVSRALESISLADICAPDFMPVFRLERSIPLTEVQH